MSRFWCSTAIHGILDTVPTLKSGIYPRIFRYMTKFWCSLAQNGWLARVPTLKCDLHLTNRLIQPSPNPQIASYPPLRCTYVNWTFKIQEIWLKFWWAHAQKGSLKQNMSRFWCSTAKHGILDTVPTLKCGIYPRIFQYMTKFWCWHAQNGWLARFPTLKCDLHLTNRLIHCENSKV